MQTRHLGLVKSCRTAALEWGKNIEPRLRVRNDAKTRRWKEEMMQNRDLGMMECRMQVGESGARESVRTATEEL
eukprot:4470519-Pyramimonas_sp.AAC.1